MSGARGCFNCGGCALLFLRQCLGRSKPYPRCRLLPFVSPIIACNSSNKFCTRTSYATLFTILRNIFCFPLLSLLNSLSLSERSPNVLLDDLVGHQAANCPKAGTPTW
ncbi:hypothetical protein BDM02DRAFT_3110595 [Thelephora ganbajun]|uniref:Uncharacterized protein n=1 Tax=Thelephora ganbajun TaxID=370292 RepID=A0ACB6ZQS1_THEGA|nr:hypothetical protein BDM02DRAFT_3110595 [Thelephora ganbajun]